MSILKDLYTIIIFKNKLVTNIASLYDDGDNFVSYSNQKSFTFDTNDSINFNFLRRVKNFNIEESFDNYNKTLELSFSYDYYYDYEENEGNKGIRIINKNIEKQLMIHDIAKNDTICVFAGSLIDEPQYTSTTDVNNIDSYYLLKKRLDQTLLDKVPEICGQNLIFQGYVTDVTLNEQTKELVVNASTTSFFKDIFVPNGVFSLDKDNLATVLSSINTEVDIIRYNELEIDATTKKINKTEKINNTYYNLGQTFDVNNDTSTINYYITYDYKIAHEGISNLADEQVSKDLSSNLNRLLDKYKEYAGITVQIVPKTTSKKNGNTISYTSTNYILIKQGLLSVKDTADSNGKKIDGFVNKYYIPERFIFQKNITTQKLSDDDIDKSITIKLFNKNNRGKDIILKYSINDGVTKKLSNRNNTQSTTLLFDISKYNISTNTTKEISTKDIETKILNNKVLIKELTSACVIQLNNIDKAKSIQGYVVTKIIQFDKTIRIENVDYEFIDAIKVSDELIIENENLDGYNTYKQNTQYILYRCNKVEYYFNDNGLYQKVYVEAVNVDTVYSMMLEKDNNSSAIG